MKTTAPYPRSTVTPSRTSSNFRPEDEGDDRKTQIAFYFFAGLLALALLYFVILTFML